MHMVKSFWRIWAYYCAAFAQQVPFPSTLEVDLVFPRNDTYAPTRVFPIVFAIQNPLLSVPLIMGIDYVLFSQGTTDGSNVTKAVNGIIPIRNGNFSNTDHYFAHRFTTGLNLTEGSWSLTWTVGSGNCSASPVSPYQTHVSFQNHNNVVFFTTKKGAEPPDLVVATDQGTCGANTQTQTYNVTGTLKTPEGEKYEGRETCAVLSPTSPSPAANPCRARIDAAAAASISAAITATACFSPDSGITCPPDKNSAGGPLGGSRCLVVAVGLVNWLLLVL